MSYMDLTADERAEIVANRAELKHGKYTSLHEAYAVLHEECDELEEVCDEGQWDAAELLSQPFLDMWESVKSNNIHAFLASVREVARIAGGLKPTSVAMEGEMIDVAAVCSRILKQWDDAPEPSIVAIGATFGGPNIGVTSAVVLSGNKTLSRVDAVWRFKGTLSGQVERLSALMDEYPDAVVTVDSTGISGLPSEMLGSLQPRRRIREIVLTTNSLKEYFDNMSAMLQASISLPFCEDLFYELVAVRKGVDGRDGYGDLATALAIAAWEMPGPRAVATVDVGK